MRPYLIYMAGPIAGLTYKDARYGWRQHFKNLILDNASTDKIRCVSPMRYKHDLADHDGPLPQAGHPEIVLSSPRGIVTRDRWDAQRVDLLFCNLLGATRVSIGTMIELGWADTARVPILLAIEPEGNPHDHCMVREMAGFTVDSVEAAAETALAVLSEGV